MTSTPTITTPRRNLITDIEGLRVGNAADPVAKTGVTVLICDEPAAASCHVMGGAPGTRDTDLLAPHGTVPAVDALFLSGGSAFGIDAGGGVQAALKEQGRGFIVGDQSIPIAPGAILFDMLNGGNKDWGRYPPHRELGHKATNAAARDFELGTAGAGTGALVAGLKGGLGSASASLPNGGTVGALVAVNALGTPCVGDTKHFWAAPFEQDGEFGGHGLPAPMPRDAGELRIKFREQQAAGANTTIGIIATDLALTKAECQRLAMAAHDGFARALWPAHTPLDGDLIFAVSTGKHAAPDIDQWIDLCAAAAATMARAIARGVYEASEAEDDLFACWQKHWGAD
ncbi:MAG: P1 family peptidase [Nitratireductor sp.]|nr:P1 family peptidase [Nitratireductor sp.]